MLLRYLRNWARFGRIDPIEYYASHEHRLVYVENAKVACTAIKQALFHEINYAELGQEAFHEVLRDRASTIPPPGTQDYTYFTVVREPCARFASAFRDKIVKESVDGIFGLRSQRLIFGAYAGINPVAPTTDIAAFARAVAAIPDGLRDRHIASQSAVCEAVIAHPNGRIFKLETLASDWEELVIDHGIGPLPKLNATSGEAAPAIDSSASWVRDVVKAYAQDFSRLDYQEPGKR